MNSGSAGKSKLKLTIQEGINFHLIGISSHENDYRLVWAINNKLNMKFVKTDNLSVSDGKLGHAIEFSKYMFDDEDRYLKFYLVANRCPDGILLAEIKNFDYIIQIFGELSGNSAESFLKELRQVDIISAAFAIKPESLKGIKKVMNY